MALGDRLQFLVTATPRADTNLAYFKAFEQRVIFDAVKVQLVKFMAFLGERCKEQGSVSLEDIERRWSPVPTSRTA